MITEGKGLKGMVSKREKRMNKATCLPMDCRNEDSERSRAGLERQSTPKRFPSGFPISVADTIVHPIAQARNPGVILDCSLLPQSLIGY